MWTKHRPVKKVCSVLAPSYILQREYLHEEKVLLIILNWDSMGTLGEFFEMKRNETDSAQNAGM